MKTQHRRSGGNRRGGPRGARRGYRRGNAPRPPEKPKTFWEKILAFFKGESATTRATRPTAATRPETSSASPARPRGPKPPRSPEPAEVNSPKLYVGNLSYDAAESDLFELFNGVGSVRNAEVVSHRRTQRSKGFAFVTMQSVDEARRAVETLHDQEFMGRKLVVSGAKSNGDSGGASEQEE